MTTLDKQALEKVTAKLAGFGGLAPGVAEELIRTYLAALPEARRRYIIVPDTGDDVLRDEACWLFESLAEASEDCEADERVITLEIREVRQP